jgi:DNA polymerase III epsilon subunit-like protein
MPHLNGSILTSIDLECTGLQAGYHEPIQIALTPLDENYDPLYDVRPFYMEIAPLFPSRAEKSATKTHGLDLMELTLHALHPDVVADLLVEWVTSLDLPGNKLLVPLAHNWSYERAFLNAWLGEAFVSRYFHAHARDSMMLAIAINDRAFDRGYNPPFRSLKLTSLCNKFGIVNEKPHDALHDCIAAARLYRELLRFEVLE